MKTYFVEDVLEELGIKWIWGLERIWRRGRVRKKGLLSLVLPHAAGK